MKPYVYNVGTAFEAVVREYGERPALRLGSGSTVTYEDLDRHANRIASVLRAHGIARRDVIGIVHTKTVACYAMMIAALKIGATYVNLDDQNPLPRIEHIFATARPAIVFGESIPAAVRDAASACNAPLLDLADPALSREIERASSEAPAATERVIGSDPAYIMYTSGSTGIPKGAVMTHANVLNFAQWCKDRFELTPADVLTNLNPMYFDNSVFDFYGSMLNGASIAVVTRETLADGMRTIEQVEAAGCTVWFSVPSLLVYLTTLKVLNATRLPSIKQFVFGGEGYPKPELRRLFDAFGSRARLVNVYGPTECTCICSAWNVTEADLDDRPGLVTLGAVADNFAALVLTDGRAALPGESGELCLLGPQVGLGYVNDPVRTETSFVANPTNGAWHERMYKTGDLVRRDEDGNKLHFVGRIDNQIKHMGYRIELEEIEAALNKVDGVAQSAVVQKHGRGGVKILAAYVATARELEEGTIRNALEGLLPPYMIPQRFEVRDHLPKNANGKVDRIALAKESDGH